jgi:hypothetical protein
MSVEWDVAPFGKENQDKRGGCGERLRSEMRSLKTECFEMASLHFCRYLSALRGCCAGCAFVITAATALSLSLSLVYPYMYSNVQGTLPLGFPKLLVTFRK